ncbi:MAG: hypothetical protein LBT46_00970 [Planctomycetaceae bacterium]|jgi:hypothetical protein|nr:hypothetical protein [Planctomycetaceae bacterium]
MSNEQAETSVENQAKPECCIKSGGNKRCRCCRCCCFGCLIAVLIAAVPFWWFCLHTTPLQISKETTYVTGPMKSDGKQIDYFRAVEELIYPPEMQTDNNGYRLLVRACGILERELYGEDAETYRLQIYEKLALDPNVQPTLAKEGVELLVGHYIRKLYAPGENKDTADISKEVRNGVQKVWTLEQYPQMKNYLDGANPFIDLVGEAVRKPAYCSPYVRKSENDLMIGIVLHDCQITREIARSVLARANYRIGIGDIDGAIYDTVTVYRLGRHASKHGLFVGALIGIALESSAAGVGIGGNPAHQPAKGQLEHFMKELQSLPERCTFVESFGTERLFALGSIQDIFRGDLHSDLDMFGPPAWLWLRWSVDRNVVLRRFNEFFTQAEQGSAVFDDASFFKKNSPSVNPFRYLPVRSRSENVCGILLSLLAPATNAAEEAWNRSDCCYNMKCLTLALLLYEKEYGKMPEGDWQAAVKPYLGKDADKYFRCPSAGSPDETVYALVRYDNAVPVTPETILIAEAEKVKLSAGSGLILNEPSLFMSKHIGVSGTTLHSGAVRYQSKEQREEKKETKVK